MKYLACSFLLAAALFAAVPAPAQEIVTATQYFGNVADRYAQIGDYEGKIASRPGPRIHEGRHLSSRLPPSSASTSRARPTRSSPSTGRP